MRRRTAARTWACRRRVVKELSWGRLRWHDSFIRVPWFIHMCDMTHALCDMTHALCDMTNLYAWHDSCIRVAWRIDMCYMTAICFTWLRLSYVVREWTWRRLREHDSFICLSWLIYMCLYVCCDSFVRVTYAWHDSCVWHSYEVRGHYELMHTKVMKLLHVCHDSFIDVPCVALQCVAVWFIWSKGPLQVEYQRDKTLAYVCHDSFINVTYMCVMTHS